MQDQTEINLCERIIIGLKTFRRQHGEFFSISLQITRYCGAEVHYLIRENCRPDISSQSTEKNGWNWESIENIYVYYPVIYPVHWTDNMPLNKLVPLEFFVWLRSETKRNQTRPVSLTFRLFRFENNNENFPSFASFASIFFSDVVSYTSASFRFKIF